MLKRVICNLTKNSTYKKKKKKRSSIFLLFELILKRISTPVDYNNNKYTYIISEVDPRCDDDNYYRY